MHRNRIEELPFRGKMMPPWRWLLVLGLVLVTSLWTALWVNAGTIRPNKTRLRDETLSLAGLKQIQVDVGKLPWSLKAKGMTQELVLKLFRDHLADARFDLADEPDLPRVLLRVTAVTDPNQPGALCLLSVISVHQKFILDRLDREVSVPTANFQVMALTTTNVVDKTFKRNLRLATRTFVKHVVLASQAP